MEKHGKNVTRTNRVRTTEKRNNTTRTPKAGRRTKTNPVKENMARPKGVRRMKKSSASNEKGYLIVMVVAVLLQLFSIIKYPALQ